MAKKFDFEGARKAGYSDQEITSHLAQSHPKFDFQGAVNAGYTPEEIYQHLNVKASEERQPSRAKSLAFSAGKGLVEGASALNPIAFGGPIKEEMGQRVLEKAFPSQEKEAEKLLHRAGKLAPIVGTGPEGALMKGLQLGAGVLGGHLAEEEGLGEGGQAVAETLGFSLPGLFKALGMKAGQFLGKGLKGGAGEATARLAKIKPEQVNEGVREAAQRLGVLEDLPLSAQVENPYIQAAETKLMQSATGGAIQQKLERTGGKLVETYQDAAKTLSARENMLPSVVSAEAANVLKNMEERATQGYRALYAKASEALPPGAVTGPKVGMAIHKVIDQTIEKLRSALGTPSKDALVNRLTRLKDTWSANESLRRGLFPVKELETLGHDLNQVIKYETKGGVDKLLTPLKAVVKEGIQSYGKTSNPLYLSRFNEAERMFGQNAKMFRKDPVLKVLVKGENPEQIFGKMSTRKGINDLERAFTKTAEGREVMDALKRYKLEDILNKKVLDKNGEISWGKAAGMFKEAKTRDLVSRLVGPQQYQKLKDLSKVASGVEQGFKKFLNTSKTATTAIDTALLVALPIKATQQLFSGNVLGALKTTAMVLGPSQLANLIASPKFVEAAIATAKSGMGNNASLFMKHAQRVAQFTAMEMLKNQPELSPEQENGEQGSP